MTDTNTTTTSPWLAALDGHLDDVAAVAEYLDQRLNEPDAHHPPALGVAEIARGTGLSFTIVTACIATLASSDWIHVQRPCQHERESHAANRYCIQIPHRIAKTMEPSNGARCRR